MKKLAIASGTAAFLLPALTVAVQVRSPLSRDGVLVLDKDSVSFRAKRCATFSAESRKNVRIGKNSRVQANAEVVKHPSSLILQGRGCNEHASQKRKGGDLRVEGHRILQGCAQIERVSRATSESRPLLGSQQDKHVVYDDHTISLDNCHDDQQQLGLLELLASDRRATETSNRRQQQQQQQNLAFPLTLSYLQTAQSPTPPERDDVSAVTAVVFQASGCKDFVTSVGGVTSRVADLGNATVSVTNCGRTGHTMSGAGILVSGEECEAIELRTPLKANVKTEGNFTLTDCQRTSVLQGPLAVDVSGPTKTAASSARTSSALSSGASSLLKKSGVPSAAARKRDENVEDPVRVTDAVAFGGAGGPLQFAVSLQTNGAKNAVKNFAKKEFAVSDTVAAKHIFEMNSEAASIAKQENSQVQEAASSTSRGQDSASTPEDLSALAAADPTFGAPAAPNPELFVQGGVSPSVSGQLVEDPTTLSEDQHTAGSLSGVATSKEKSSLPVEEDDHKKSEDKTIITTHEFDPSSAASGAVGNAQVDADKESNEKAAFDLADTSKMLAAEAENAEKELAAVIADAAAGKVGTSAGVGLMGLNPSGGNADLMAQQVQEETQKSDKAEVAAQEDKKVVDDELSKQSFGVLDHPADAPNNPKPQDQYFSSGSATSTASVRNAAHGHASRRATRKHKQRPVSTSHETPETNQKEKTAADMIASGELEGAAGGVSLDEVQSSSTSLSQEKESKGEAASAGIADDATSLRKRENSSRSLVAITSGSKSSIGATGNAAARRKAIKQDELGRKKDQSPSSKRLASRRAVTGASGHASSRRHASKKSAAVRKTPAPSSRPVLLEGGVPSSGADDLDEEDIVEPESLSDANYDGWEDDVAVEEFAQHTSGSEMSSGEQSSKKSLRDKDPTPVARETGASLQKEDDVEDAQQVEKQTDHEQADTNDAGDETETDEEKEVSSALTFLQVSSVDWSEFPDDLSDAERSSLTSLLQADAQPALTAADVDMYRHD